MIDAANIDIYFETHNIFGKKVEKYAHKQGECA